MHGLGNDYVYVDVHAQDVAAPEALARAMSDRHRGVGSDGLILIALAGNADADARMLMFNADGTRGEMCGNGIRCVAKYVFDHGISQNNPLRIATDAGVKTLELTLGDDGKVAQIRVDMGTPGLAPDEVPMLVDGAEVVDYPLEVDGETYVITGVSMGNPHAVAFVDDVSAVPLERVGPLFEHHALFPERVNMHFAEVRGPGEVRMRTWERGSGITQACGTGACAVCVAGVLSERTQPTLVAHLPGGALSLEWDRTSRHVFMTGPATEVFHGEWPD
jgi:diaminopimelate epimerase